MRLPNLFIYLGLTMFFWVFLGKNSIYFTKVFSFHFIRFYPKFQLVSKVLFSCFNSQIQLNRQMDDHHFSYITKLNAPNNCLETISPFLWGQGLNTSQEYKLILKLTKINLSTILFTEQFISPLSPPVSIMKNIIIPNLF